jgi:hypothetical protein
MEEKQLALEHFPSRDKVLAGSAKVIGIGPLFASCGGRQCLLAWSRDLSHVLEHQPWRKRQARDAGRR